MSTPDPKKQTYQLRIVSGGGVVKGPELSFEEAARMLLVFKAEGFDSIEAWTLDRPVIPVEAQALIDRALELRGKA